MAISYAFENRVAQLGLDDGKANAMHPAWFEALNDALDRAASDRASAIVISGREGFFSGGLDVKRMASLGPDGIRGMARTFAHTMIRVFTSEIPTIAAVSGHAIAGGAILAFACDVRLAVNGPFKLQMNEVLIGIPVPTWMSLIASTAVPSHELSPLLLQARTYAPEQAHALGIYNGLANSAEELSAAAGQAAVAFSAVNPQAYIETKHRLRGAQAELALELLDESELPG